MKKLSLITLLVFVAGTVSAGLVGHWNLNGDFSSDGAGAPLSLVGANLLSLGYTNDTIGGSAAQELSFPAFDGYSKLINVPNEAANPNNNYTIVMDVKFPTIGGFTSLLDFDHSGDAELFISANGGGIGIGGHYDGVVNQGTWYRIALAAYASGTDIIWSKYIDGSLVGTQVLDNASGRFSIYGTFSLFTDNGAETSAGMINSLAYFNSEKNATFISNLGGASAGGVTTSDPDLEGLWQFNDALVNDVASAKPISLAPSFGTDKIDGSDADIFNFSAFSPTEWLQMPNNSATVPTEDWTLVMDVNYPVVGSYGSFYQLDTANAGDGDLFVIPSGGIGLGGVYDGNFSQGAWHRLAVTYSGGTNLSKYIDGTKVGSQIIGSDQGTMQNIALLFTDNDNEDSAGMVNSIALWDETKGDAFINSLGGASASGIPVPEPVSVIFILAALAGLFIRDKAC